MRAVDCLRVRKLTKSDRRLHQHEWQHGAWRVSPPSLEQKYPYASYYTFGTRS